MGFVDEVTVRHDTDRAPVAVPMCPVCGATGYRCETPTGRFHESRELLVAAACGCGLCRNYMAVHASSQPVLLGYADGYDSDLLDH